MEVPCLKTCKSDELAKYLIHQRFQKNATQAAGFLQSALDHVENKGSAASKASNGEDGGASDDGASACAIVTSKPTELIIGEAITRECEVSVMKPRVGKCALTVHEHGLCFTKKPSAAAKAKADVQNGPADVVRWIVQSSEIRAKGGGIAVSESEEGTPSAVSHLVLFPKPEDCRKAFSKSNKTTKPRTADLVLLCFDTPRHDLPNTKKPVDQVCFSLPFDKTQGGALSPHLAPDDGDDNDNGDGNDGGGLLHEEASTNRKKNPTLLWQNLFVQHLGLSQQSQLSFVARPEESGLKPEAADESSYAFASFQAPNTSTTTGNMPFVRCYSGVQDGVLFPMRSGLLFFKPPSFLPRERLASIACGRGSGGGGSGNASRYVDLVVEVHNSSSEAEHSPDSNPTNGDQHENATTPMEFSNIAREEVGVLNNYIHSILIPAMQQDVNAHDAAAEGADSSEEAVLAKEAASSQDESLPDATAVAEDDDTEDDGDGAMSDGISDEEDEVFMVDGDNDDDRADSNNHSGNGNEEEEDDDHDSADDEILLMKGGDRMRSTTAQQTKDKLSQGDGDVEVVEDEFAKELAKRKANDSETESEADDDDEETGNGGSNDNNSRTRNKKRMSKRLRRP